MHSDHPVIRLKPKTNAQRLRHGFPWVYDNELVTDRRTKAIAPGSLAILQDHGQNTLGLFAMLEGWLEGKTDKNCTSNDGNAGTGWTTARVWDNED